tara:strand:+ start:252 stop:359 length:108 start_codon:yes stop_codon:yes gene_type:complete
MWGKPRAVRDRESQRKNGQTIRKKASYKMKSIDLI